MLDQFWQLEFQILGSIWCISRMKDYKEKKYFCISKKEKEISCDCDPPIT
jgi:hypothetical protein